MDALRANGQVPFVILVTVYYPKARRGLCQVALRQSRGLATAALKKFRLVQGFLQMATNVLRVIFMNDYRLLSVRNCKEINFRLAHRINFSERGEGAWRSCATLSGDNEVRGNFRQAVTEIY